MCKKLIKRGYSIKSKKCKNFKLITKQLNHTEIDDIDLLILFKDDDLFAFNKVVP